MHKKPLILACFSIGLGAALTPIGEPLATITISKLNEDFFYLIKLIGTIKVLIIPSKTAQEALHCTHGKHKISLPKKYSLLFSEA